MDINKIKEIIEVFNDNKLTVLEVEENKNRIRIERTVTSAHPSTSAAVSPQDVAVHQTSSFETIKSPLVGIFYRSSSPNEKPFVSVGDSIKKGDILCVIEAMKTMSEVRSDYEGVVREILVDNEASVEYHQPLFMIG